MSKNTTKKEKGTQNPPTKDSFVTTQGNTKSHFIVFAIILIVVIGVLLVFSGESDLFQLGISDTEENTTGDFVVESRNWATEEELIRADQMRQEALNRYELETKYIEGEL